MTKIWIVTMVLLLAACKKTAGPVDQEALESIESMVNTGGLKYAQDPNTSLCFAYGYVERGSGQQSATGGPIVTWVPCDSLQVEVTPK